MVIVCLQATLGTCYLLLGLAVGGDWPCYFEFSLAALLTLMALIPVKNKKLDIDQTDGLKEIAMHTYLSIKEKVLRLAR